MTDSKAQRVSDLLGRIIDTVVQGSDADRDALHQQTLAALRRQIERSGPPPMGLVTPQPEPEEEP
jgi:hypothetical protein